MIPDKDIPEMKLVIAAMVNFHADDLTNKYKIFIYCYCSAKLTIALRLVRGRLQFVHRIPIVLVEFVQAIIVMACFVLLFMERLAVQ